MIEDDWIMFYQWWFWSKIKWFRCCGNKTHCCRYDGVASCYRHERGRCRIISRCCRFVTLLQVDERDCCCKIAMLQDCYFVAAGSFLSLHNHSTLAWGSHIFRDAAWSSSSMMQDHHPLLLQDWDVVAGSPNCCRFDFGGHGIPTSSLCHGSFCYAMGSSCYAAGSFCYAMGSFCYAAGLFCCALRRNQRGLVASYREPFNSVALKDEWTVWDVDSFLETWVV